MASKKFSIEDFIRYNNPCVSCGDKISLYFETKKKSERNTASLSPILDTEYLLLEPKIKYNLKDSLRLIIFYKTNKINTNHWGLLTQYISEHTIKVRSRCSTCKSEVVSGILKFDLEKKIIYATEILYESLKLQGKNELVFHLYTAHANEKTSVTVFKNGVNIPELTINEMSPIYLYQYRDRAKIVNKIEIYLTFM